MEKNGAKGTLTKEEYETEMKGPNRRFANYLAGVNVETLYYSSLGYSESSNKDGLYFFPYALEMPGYPHDNIIFDPRNGWLGAQPINYVNSVSCVSGTPEK